MWVLSWKNYALSKLATFVSVIGAFVRYAGVVCLFSSLILPGIICIAIGIAIHFCAEEIAKAKAKKISKKQQTVPPVKETHKPNTTPNPQPEVKQETATEPVTSQPTKVKKCIRCGEVVDATKNFCANCGYEIK